MWSPLLTAEEGVATGGHPYNDFKPELSQGWVSPRYGIKEAAPVVSVASRGQANVDFYTLIAPRELSTPLPQFQVLTESHIRIDSVGRNFNEVDELSWQANKEPVWRRTSL